LKPGKYDAQEVTYLAGGAQVLDKEGDLVNALIEAQVAEVNKMIDQQRRDGLIIRNILHTAKDYKRKIHQA
jgi:hypothetical protein